jgi:K+-transporting ATPase ATPase C chain
MKSIKNSLLMFIWLTLLTGVVYPLIVTGIAWITFPAKSEGDFITVNDKIVGSKLIGQKFESNKYFWSRPSANDYNGLISGGSNLGPTSIALKKAVDERRKKFAGSQEVPPDLLFASGSGLDPHITPEAAYYQIDRIAKARGMDNPDGLAKLQNLVNDAVEKPFWHYLGHQRVNVLLLNLKLDNIAGK